MSGRFAFLWRLFWIAIVAYLALEKFDKKATIITMVTAFLVTNYKIWAELDEYKTPSFDFAFDDEEPFFYTSRGNNESSISKELECFRIKVKNKAISQKIRAEIVQIKIIQGQGFTRIESFLPLPLWWQDNGDGKCVERELLPNAESFIDVLRLSMRDHGCFIISIQHAKKDFEMRPHDTEIEAKSNSGIFDIEFQFKVKFVGSKGPIKEQWFRAWIDKDTSPKRPYHLRMESLPNP